MAPFGTRDEERTGSRRRLNDRVTRDDEVMLGLHGDLRVVADDVAIATHPLATSMLGQQRPVRCKPQSRRKVPRHHAGDICALSVPSW